MDMRANTFSILMEGNNHPASLVPPVATVCDDEHMLWICVQTLYRRVEQPNHTSCAESVQQPDQRGALLLFQIGEWEKENTPVTFCV